MKSTAAASFEGDVDLTNPDVTGLDDVFDRIVSDIPQSLIQAADDIALDPELSRDPLAVLRDVRDRCGHVVQGDNGLFGGRSLGNTFGVDYSKPHFARYMTLS